MASLKNLLGSNPKDREFAEEMRAVLQEMHQERARFEALLNSAESSAERLQEVREPIARAASDVDAVAQRLAEVEQRFASMAQVSDQLQSVAQRSESLLQNHQQAQTEIASTLEETQRIRALFEELGQKVDAAVEPQGAARRVPRGREAVPACCATRPRRVREQVEDTGEQLARLREQHDRLIDAHKLAMSKMEALDRRRDELGRSLQDKERRVASVERPVRGMDGVQHTVDDVRREIGTLKALADTVAQKTAALEAQREAVERALAQADQLDRAMRQIDAGVRQQQENEKALSALQDQVAALRSLHEAVIERSGEISQLQREIDERTQATRQELAAVTRRDEEDRRALRLREPRPGVGQPARRRPARRALRLREALQGLERVEPRGGRARGPARRRSGSQLPDARRNEVGQVDQEMAKLRAIRRDLDETGRSVRELATQVAADRGGAAGRRSGAAATSSSCAAAHATGQGRAGADPARPRRDRPDAREPVGDPRPGSRRSSSRWPSCGEQVGELQRMSPTIEAVQKQAQRLSESMTTIESRREFIEDLHRRMAYLERWAASSTSAARQLQAHMEAAEQRFLGLAASAEEAERMTTTIAAVSSSLNEAGRKTAEIVKTVPRSRHGASRSRSSPSGPAP